MRKYIKQIISRLQDNYMTKNYYSAIATICLVLLLSITCISKSYAHNNDSITTKVEVENEAKNDFEINKLLKQVKQKLLKQKLQLPLELQYSIPFFSFC